MATSACRCLIEIPKSAAASRAGKATRSDAEECMKLLMQGGALLRVRCAPRAQKVCFSRRTFTSPLRKNLRNRVTQDRPGLNRRYQRRHRRLFGRLDLDS